MPKDVSPTQRIRSFVIEVLDPDTGLIEVDSDWESCTGGGVNIEPPRPDARTTTPGHKYIDTLTLRGPVTAGRKALVHWVSLAASGKSSRRSITVKEILKDGSAGKTYTYHDCFPVRYAGPRQSVEGGALYEEVTVKPIRLELS
jgi:hypothetical protein